MSFGARRNGLRLSRQSDHTDRRGLSLATHPDNQDHKRSSQVEIANYRRRRIVRTPTHAQSRSARTVAGEVLGFAALAAQLDVEGGDSTSIALERGLSFPAWSRTEIATHSR